MTRKLAVISGLLLVAVVMGALGEGLAVNTSDEAQAVRETILRARRIDIEAEYTFDTSLFDTVYINDPLGGEMPDEALAQIQAVRQDPTIQKDQVGFLDYEKAAIENLKREYESFLEELRARQAAGTLNEGDRQVLEIATQGWPTPEPTDADAVAQATQACELYIAAAMQPTPEPSAAYPLPEPVIEEPVYVTDSGTPYPMPEPISPPKEIGCPTAIPAPLPVSLPYRGSDPATLPPEEFDIDIYSIEIEGDIARAVVHKRAVTSEFVLVKVDGQWYIAGAKLLKFAP